MEARHLPAMVEELLEDARVAPAGRAARTLSAGEGPGLRQTLLALGAGRELAEHESPGAATLQVLRGRMRLVAGDETVDLGTGDLAPIPPTRHHLAAQDDSVVLLTVAS